MCGVAQKCVERESFITEQVINSNKFNKKQDKRTNINNEGRFLPKPKLIKNESSGDLKMEWC